MINSYKDLNVWKDAMELVVIVYNLSKFFPKEEIYGLSSQIRRASVSIPSNIAEGHQRHSKKEFLQFLGIARGSLAELETQLMIAERLNYINQEQLNSTLILSQKTGNLLGGLIRSLER